MKPINNRQKFLNALLEYADKSGNFNPHFDKNEMMETLGVTESQFNIMQKQLGDKYCHYIDSHMGKPRYSINLSECLSLKEIFDQEAVQGKRHAQLVRLVVLVAILGAVLGVALGKWL